MTVDKIFVTRSFTYIPLQYRRIYLHRGKSGKRYLSLSIFRSLPLMQKRFYSLSGGGLGGRSPSLVRLSSLGISRAFLSKPHLPGHPCLSASSFLYTTTRGVQYVHSSETLSGINKKKRQLTTKWVTKSTKEYIQEVDDKVHRAPSIPTTRWEKRQEISANRKTQIKQIQEASQRAFQQELDRLQEDKSRQFRKTYNFFKRQGWPFFVLYVAAYFGTWFALYLGFASGFLKKEAAFDFLIILLGVSSSRDQFYERIEAWDTYVNVGFGFVVNEMIEVIRFTIVLAVFLEFRPFFTGVNRFAKRSIFRMGASES
ncbi:unnamed protein product [Phytomonas sp. Hart1]|nr:unnamed protein product [Phytomonas sp. Hart1]|eukprot:CCW71466.1 unnamed protein product [Phytomonas sp. isolate Hart1]